MPGSVSYVLQNIGNIFYSHVNLFNTPNNPTVKIFSLPHLLYIGLLRHHVIQQLQIIQPVNGRAEI